MAFKKYTEGTANYILDYYECSCYSSEHCFIFRIDLDDGQVYLSPYLCSHFSFFKRLIYGIKYIFGHKSDYGAFDEIIIKREDIKNLRNLFEEYDKVHEELEKRSKEKEDGSNS